MTDKSFVVETNSSWTAAIARIAQAMLQEIERLPADGIGGDRQKLIALLYRLHQPPPAERLDRLLEAWHRDCLSNPPAARDAHTHLVAIALPELRRRLLELI